MQITLDIDDITAPLLATLDDEGSPEGTIYRLIDSFKTPDSSAWNIDRERK